MLELIKVLPLHLQTFVSRAVGNTYRRMTSNEHLKHLYKRFFLTNGSKYKIFMTLWQTPSLNLIMGINEFINKCGVWLKFNFKGANLWKTKRELK